ncbi:hypothetical protein [Paenibacillus tundrae]
MSDTHFQKDQFNPLKAIENASMEDIQSWILEIEKTPFLLRNLLDDIEQGQLEKSYPQRDGQ